MPSHTVTPSLLTFPSSLFDSPLDVKARAEYERDRQKALKGHDVRKKLSPSSTPPPARRPGLGHGNAWRNSVITLDDMEDLYGECFEVDEDDRSLLNKENSKPSPRVTQISLEDLVRTPKSRKSMSRITLSRQASVESLTATFPTMGLTSPPASFLPSISESSSDPSLDPMLPFTLPDDDSDDESSSFTYDEFSSPGADDWSMDEIADGSVGFINPSSCVSSVSSFAVVVERSAW